MRSFQQLSEELVKETSLLYKTYLTMRKIKLLAAVIAVSSILTACSSTPEAASPEKLEYKVVEFQREQADTFEKSLNDLANEGWSYTGELTANGINGRYIIFQKPKK